MKKRKIKISAKKAEPQKTIPFVLALANKVFGILGFTDYR